MAQANMNKKHYIFHATIYYIAWLVCILSAAHGIAWINTLIVLMLVSLQYYWQYRIQHQFKGLNSFVIVLTTLGTVSDTILLHLKLITFSANPFSPYLSPPWMISLWINFAIVLYSTLSHLFSHKYLLSALSLLGFSIAYASGGKMGAAAFPHGYTTTMLIGLIWMILLPASIYFLKRRIN